MPSPNARLTLRMTQVSSNQKPYRYTSLEIQDVDSTLTLASFVLAPEHVVDLIAGRLVGDVDGVAAWLVEPAERPLLGRLMGTTVRHFPTGSYDESAVIDWCAKNGPAIGAHSWSVRQNNGGMHVAVWRHYVDVQTADELDAVIERRQDTMDVLPEPGARA